MSHIEPYGGQEALLIHESTHDTFDSEKHLNWLCNNAGLGAYAHGRIHQDIGTIYVGDLIHKRGHKMTDDVLLMEEQALDSMGEPLSAPSRMGKLMAVEILPTMSTANGEGDLIAYYQKGVVAFNTHETPRETRADGNGKITQQGWDSKRLVNHLLNKVGSVGRYAVAVLTRDHFFRSIYGLHFLKVVLGEGTFNSENINIISQDISPILERDVFLEGAACGVWFDGHREFASTGLIKNEKFSSSSYGRGFVSWNQAVGFTEDRTPINAWEGLWIVDKGIEGIHKFVDIGLGNAYGFICSDTEWNLQLGTLKKDLDVDRRSGDIPIKWSFETGQFAPLGLDKRGDIKGGTFEATYSDASQIVQLWIRTDVATEWALWTTIQPCDKKKKIAQKLRLMADLSKPPLKYRECSWFQIKVNGIGYFEDPLFSLDFSPTTVKSGRKSCTIIDESNDNYFELRED